MKSAQSINTPKLIKTTLAGCSPRRFTVTAAAALVFAVAAMSRTPELHAQATATGAPSAADAPIQADVLKALKKSQFKSVTVSVNNGTVTLGGSVGLSADKEDADKKVHHVHTVGAVANQIQVGGPVVPDAVLFKKLSDKIAWDRIGYGTTPFNAIEIQVHNGAVIMTGHAYGPVDKDSALGLVEYYPGVKDVVDNVDVDPVSDFDDRTRIATYRSIYGFPALSRYGSDPAKPIRITVINGNVTLSGVVDRQTDKDMAYLRANSVPGVFKVINNLQVVPYKDQKEPRTSNTVSVNK